MTATNALQRLAVEEAMKGKNIFITGSAGTGKSFVIRYLHSIMADSLLCSTTGIGATIIGGQTIHSALGIGLCTNSVEDMATDQRIRCKFTKLKVLILDEVSMLSMKTFEKLCKLARTIRGNDLPFGGVQIIFSGDFLQLPPVKDRFVFESPEWERLNLQIIELVDVVRQKDNKFVKHLQLVRKGEISPETKKYFESRIIDESLKQVIRKNKIKPTILLSHISNVDRFNTFELEKLLSRGRIPYEYKLTHIMCPDKWRPPVVEVPDLIKLCIGAQVILRVNLDVSAGLVNGARGVIIKFEKKCPVVEFMSGHVRTIRKHIWETTRNDLVIHRYSQIPLLLGWAITIHKSQGMTLDNVILDISKCFENGQAYVALSRVSTIEGLFLMDVCWKNLTASAKALEFYLTIERSEV